jgi:glucosamine--fructose-6-phosphate aminotransferase (isomerizing)
VVTQAGYDGFVAARATSPLVLGLADGETFVASDVPALLPYTRTICYLVDGEMAEVRAGHAEIRTLDGEVRPLRPETIEWDAEAAEKGGWPHFMLKEIFEQPDVLRATVAGRITPDGANVELGLNLDASDIDRVVVVAAGTASYAGLVGETLIERLARIPAEVEAASEFRYREPVVNERTLVAAVSQSGETIDTLEGLREAQRSGARTLGVLNVKGSSIAREVDDVLYIHAGPEIGVASTKAYTAMVAALALLAVHLGRSRGSLTAEAARELLTELRALPTKLKVALERRDEVAAVAPALTGAKSVLYLGRGPNVASAYEGALKLKEISYLHAEAYATGEMKHGPIALIEPATPTVALAPLDELHAKTLSNLQEVRARDGRIIAIANDGDAAIASHADQVLRVPVTHHLLSPIVLAVPMQLLAYEVAVALGRDVDQPRNLAKSVTVE